MRSAVHNGMRAARRPASSRRGGGGFTLVELLVVVAVIGLLVGILVPVVRTVLDAAGAARTRARVIELADGCYNYKREREYYPGQDTYKELRGSGGSLTGSQLLAACLFDYPFADVKNTSKPPPVSGKYAPMRVGDLDKFESGGSYQARYTGEHTSILDRAEDPMAILYYPYRENVESDDVKARYKYDDNASYVDRVYHEYVAETGKTGYSMQQYRTDMQEAFYGSSYTVGPVGTPRGAGAFLLLAAGKDRLYFTGDDIRYPE